MADKNDDYSDSVKKILRQQPMSAVAPKDINSDHGRQSEVTVKKVGSETYVECD